MAQRSHQDKETAKTWAKSEAVVYKTRMWVYPSAEEGKWITNNSPPMLRPTNAKPGDVLQFDEHGEVELA